MSYNYGSETPLGVPFEEMEGSPTIKFARGSGISGTRIFRCDWNNYSTFCHELLGVIAFVAGAPVSATPLGFPGFEILIVNDIDVRPFQPNSPTGTFPVDMLNRCNTYPGGALITATYGPVDLNNDKNRPDIPDGTYLTISGDYGAEYMTIPGRCWKWDGGDSDGKPVPDDVNPGVLLPTRQYVFSWTLVAQPPDETITDIIGKINDSTFYGKDEQTLLLSGIRMHRSFQFDDSNPLWDIDYTISENRHGWNAFYSQKDGDWVKIKSATSGDPPYETADFTQLFGYNG